MSILVSVVALVLFAQSLFSLHLMLYSWEDTGRLEASRGPRSFLTPRLSFSVLLPARHEETVIYDTITRVASADYPAHLLEIVVVCHTDDDGTIAEGLRAARALPSHSIRVETFSGLPINKPRGLNIGFARTSGDVVTIFDAEDDVDPGIFNVVNTVMLQEETGIVQAGVQLMNFRDTWFGMHNCLEYFFWFKSRLHFHAKVGMIPLGGNTVFMRRGLIARVGGWDEGCLTEDAEIGLRLSLLGEPIRVVYNARHVTREETPATVVSFVKQRTRWQQGFLQVLRKGAWLGLPRMGQRLLALYTLSYPLVQAALTLLWPVTIATAIGLKLPVPVAMVSFLPLYALFLQLLVTLVGARVFVKEYDLRFPLLLPLTMTLTFLPFQWLLGVSALRAVYREARRQHNWEKTAHAGAHRRIEPVPVALFDRLLDEAGVHLGAERGSVMAVDHAANTLTIQASRGLPDAIVASTTIAVGEGIAGWVARTGRPVVVDGRQLPEDMQPRLRQPGLRSAVVLPVAQHGRMVAVLSVSSHRADLGDDAVRWLDERIRLIATDSTVASQGDRARPLGGTAMVEPAWPL